MKVAELLVEHSKYLTPNTVSERVTELAKAFLAEFGSKNLSDASKLLWLRKRSPIIIFDSRARKALNNLSYNIRATDYSEYLNCWRKEFLTREDAIRAAASRLPDVKDFTTMWSDKDDTLLDIVKSDWFIERVFDRYLWEAGKN